MQIDLLNQTSEPGVGGGAGGRGEQRANHVGCKRLKRKSAQQLLWPDSVSQAHRLETESPHTKVPGRRPRNRSQGSALLVG